MLENSLIVLQVGVLGWVFFRILQHEVLSGREKKVRRWGNKN